MTNFTNTVPYKVTAKDTVPASVNGTGTIVTAGKGIVGTGTKFKSLGELQAGSYIVSLAADEIRLVLEIESDTFARLSQPFTSDLTSATPVIIRKRDLNIKTLSVGILSGASDGEINGSVLSNGTSEVFTKEGNSRSRKRDFVDPIIIDGTGTSITVSLNR